MLSDFERAALARLGALLASAHVEGRGQGRTTVSFSSSRFDAFLDAADFMCGDADLEDVHDAEAEFGREAAV